MNLCKSCEIFYKFHEKRPKCKYLGVGACEACGESIIVTILNQTKPMEKTLKMSVETARELWKEVKDSFIEDSVNLKFPTFEKTNEIKGVAIKKLLLENFTKEELEPKKGFTWEESFDKVNRGFYVDDGAKIKQASNTFPINGNENVFKTEKQAKSALAFSQLSHIVDKYNSHEPSKKFICANGDLFSIAVERYTKGLIVVCKHRGYALLQFKSEEDAITSLEVNRVLWEQYWML